MKKTVVLISIYVIALLQSCIFFNPCGNDEFTTYFVTIENPLMKMESSHILMNLTETN